MRMTMHEQSKIAEGLSNDELKELAGLMEKHQYQFWRDMVESAAKEGYTVPGTEIDLSLLALMLSGMVRGSFIEFFFCNEMAGIKKGMSERWNALLTHVLFEGAFVKRGEA
jgi:hypothetical protein